MASVANCMFNLDNDYIYCKYWKPITYPKALVFICHGAGEHSGRYEELAENISSLGILVFSHDHIGHGRSNGEKMMISDFSIYIRDVIQHVVTTKSAYPGVPVFLLGHSMGATVSILAAYENPDLFRGMILMSPLVTTDAAPKLNIVAAKVMGVITPNAAVGKLYPESVSRDMDEVYKYQYDPLVNHEKIKAGFASQVLKATNKVRKIIPKIVTPSLILQGTNNEISDVSGAYYFMQNANCDREIKIYEGAKHHLHKETNEVKKSVMKEIETWIFNRVN
ncbi:putative monoglyceride lipase [Skunkpox virus]|uniref:Putative monoglyceride lipase n=1 Tax=Skunkpox virus TaxID=160796 RepID=A0A1C9KBI6_9POXV|nr:esterase/lipase [Skunkpox virus]AOP31514.1 putative monoglyceride lipase [Skunkpox virus]